MACKIVTARRLRQHFKDSRKRLTVSLWRRHHIEWVSLDIGLVGKQLKRLIFASQLRQKIHG